MIAPVLLLAATAALQSPPETHWLGELRIRAEAGETVSSEQGPDFIIVHVSKDARTLLSAYHGTAPNVDFNRARRFRRACGTEFFRLWSRDSGPRRIVGYLIRREAFSTHLFGEAVSGTRQSLRAFELRIIVPDC